MSRVLGKGDIFDMSAVTCIPDSTFKDEITALIAAGTAVVGKLVTLTFLNNYEVTSAADDAIPDGKIVVGPEKDNTYGYLLTVHLFHYVDQNSAHHAPVCIKNLPYATGTIALHDSVIVNGATYLNVDDGTSGGFGAVIAKHTDNTTVDVMF